MAYIFAIRTMRIYAALLWMVVGYHLIPFPAHAQQNFPRVPELTINTWVKGSKTNVKNKDTLYVIEMWATWCGPCRQSLPAMAKLQSQYPLNTLHTVALTRESQQRAKRYVRMNSHLFGTMSVAADQSAYQVLAQRFRVSSIPTVLLIQNRKLLWQGHPVYAKSVIQRIFQGRWKPDTQQQLEDLKKKADAYGQYWKDGGALTRKSKREGLQLLQDGKNEPVILNSIAWTMLTKAKTSHPPLHLALLIAKAANDSAEGKDYNILDTYARSLYLTGKQREATKIQAKALSMCQIQNGRCSDLYAVLDVYRSGGRL